FLFSVISVALVIATQFDRNGFLRRLAHQYMTFTSILSEIIIITARGSIFEARVGVWAADGAFELP
ncbi:MAG TPA: hypothetical protein VGK81_02815, partial [Anaerolineae bacterium]